MIIKLTKGKITEIDDEDAERILKHSWCAAKQRNKWRAESRIKGKLIRLHRFIMNAKPGEDVHHHDGEPLNNRKDNLIICSPRDHRKMEYKSGQRHLKLTFEDVKCIRQLNKIGCIRPFALARKFDITYRMLRYIIRGEVW